MKIVTASEMRAADEATFRELGVPSRAVMECAGREVSAFLLDILPERTALGVVFVAGAGNNGGDAFVAARALHALGVPVQVVGLKPAAELKGDALDAAESYLKGGGAFAEFQGIDQLAGFAESAAVLVDGIFGTGMRPPATGGAADLILAVNQVAAARGLPIVAIDIPSGLSSDTGEVQGSVISAAYTLALQCLKVGHVVYPAARYCGEVFVVDIGISLELPPLNTVTRVLLTAERVGAILHSLQSLRPDAHKGTRGHVAVIGGSGGKLGAPKLTGSAALHSGAGLVTLVVSETLSRTLAPALHELMCEPIAEKEGNFTAEGLKQLEAALKSKGAVVIGPGMGQSQFAKQLVEQTFRIAKEHQVALVIDADALNLVSANADLKRNIPHGSVITPHPGEMARLLDISTDAVQSFRFGCALRAAQELQCIVVLKGARTVIATPEGRTFVNPAAAPALGTGGSGDVLGGIIAAFIAQRASALDAALLGVFAHGAGGELLELRKGGMFGVLARDLIEAAADVLNGLLRVDGEPAAGVVRKVLPPSLDFLES